MPANPNKAAALTVRLATEEEPEAIVPPIRAVSQYLATIGQRGGIKGGKARAAALSPERKKEIAQKAAQARWNRGKE